eukprot:5248370-Amphidinium_carterae.1
MPGFDGSEDFYAQAAMETISSLTDTPWLTIHLPEFQQLVAFAEPQYDTTLELPSTLLPIEGVEQREVPNVLSEALVETEGSAWLVAGITARHGRSFKFVEYDVQHDHPAVIKSLRLARSQQASRVKDRDARPDAEEMRRINDVISRSRRQITAEEKLLLFRFRYSLPEKPGALTKFLHAVDWKDLEERQQATELLAKWKVADIDDALELLGKEF